MKFYCDVTVSSTPSKSRRSDVRFLMGTLKFFFVPCSWQDGKTSIFSRCANCKIALIVSMSFVFVNPRVFLFRGSSRSVGLLILRVFFSRGSSHSASLLIPRVFLFSGSSHPTGIPILRVSSSYGSSHPMNLLIQRVFLSRGSSHPTGLHIEGVFSSYGYSHPKDLLILRVSHPTDRYDNIIFTFRQLW